MSRSTNRPFVKESRKEAVLLKDKSNMLDEVNKLLDLMDTEKKALHQKIAQLELQLESNTCSTSEKKEKIIQTELPCESSSTQCVSDMWTLLMKERVQLKEMHARVEQISVYCTQERPSAQTELNKTRYLLDGTETNLRRQTRETKMLESKLAAALKVQKDLKDSNIELSHSLEEMRMKYMKSRTSLLAIKGRRSLELKKNIKAEEEKERREVMVELEREQLARNRLQEQLQTKANETDELTARLVIKEDEIDHLSTKYDGLRQGVEEGLDQLSKQLTLSRNELERVKKTLSSRQEQLNKCQLLLQQERKKSVELLSKSYCTVTQLTSQLDKERRHHEDKIHYLTLKITELKTHHAVEMDRLKHVTTKRCKELAQEIWTLKDRHIK